MTLSRNGHVPDTANAQIGVFDASVEDNYRERVLRHVIRLSPAPRFAEAVALGLGAWPETVATAYRFLGRELEGVNGPESTSEYEKQIELHAVDSEWYFNKVSAELLASRIPAGKRILLLGTPSVADVLARRSLTNVTLIDQSPWLIRRIPALAKMSELMTATINHKSALRETRYDIALLDAPWYEETLRTWLNLATRAVRPGGSIAFVLFPELTRPSALDERRRILADVEHIGTVKIHARAVAYTTPLFERNAMTAAGLPYCGDWRHGDLVVVRNVNGSHLRLDSTQAKYEKEWFTRSVGSQIIKVSALATSVAELESIRGCPNDVLPSVSARDARRADVGFWTSRNVVAGIHDPERVLRALDHLALPAKARGREDQDLQSRILSLLQQGS